MRNRGRATVGSALIIIVDSAVINGNKAMIKSQFGEKRHTLQNLSKIYDQKIYDQIMDHCLV